MQTAKSKIDTDTVNYSILASINTAKQAYWVPPETKEMLDRQVERQVKIEKGKYNCKF